jgi:3-isopropylmalate dehydrogenase
MLRHSFGHEAAAAAIEAAVDKTFAAGIATADVAKGVTPVGTVAFGDAVVRELRKIFDA